MRSYAKFSVDLENVIYISVGRIGFEKNQFESHALEAILHILLYVFEK